MAEFSTPKKFFKFIKFTPTTKKTVCILCGNKIEKSDYRRKLFHGNTNTECCELIERYLEINVTEETHTNTVCRKCVRELQKVDTVLATLKTTYKNTLSKLLETHGHESGSFKRRFSGEESVISSRKSLFSEEDKREDLEMGLHPSEKNLKIIICHGSNSDVRLVPSDHFPILDALTSGDLKTFALLVAKLPDLQETFQEEVFNTLKGEIKTLASRESNSILRDHNAIKTLTFGKVLDEWKMRAPTFLKFLEASVSNPAHQHNKFKKGEALVPGIVTAGCKLLTIYSKDLNVYQHLNSYIMWKGGCKKSAFTRLNATYDCLSYQSTLNLADKLGIDWDKDLLAIQDLVNTETTHETLLLQNLQNIKESIDLVNGDPHIMVQHILELSNAESELQQYRDLMHPGYYFVGDNVDMRTKVRNMTMLNQHKDHHMYQICAYENRVSGNDLDNTVPKGDANTIQFENFIPSQIDLDDITDDFFFFVAKIWSEHIPYLRKFFPVLPKCIVHPHMKEMKLKTKRINMGVLMKSEQYNEDMTDICEFMHKFVPGHDDSDDWTKQPEKVLSGGDYLTFERHKQAQASKRNSRTPTKRLEGLIPKMEEFHNLLKVIWKLLYSTTSARDQGTLYAARNTINARNVTQDPSDDFYAASDLVEKVTVAYIVTGGLTHFGMELLESNPTKDEYTGEVGNENEMKEFIMTHARSFVQMYTLPELPQIPQHGPQSNTLNCRYCGKHFKQVKSLRKREWKIHNHQDPLFDKNDCSTSSIPKEHDSVYAYTKLILTLGLIRIDHNDAIHMGDGARIMRINQFLVLYYKYCHCTKYAFGILETIAQSKVLLTERQAHRLIWNRTVNHKGEINSNHPNDLDLEHCNKVFNNAAHSYRGVFTEKVISRVSRSAMKVKDIVSHYDKICDVYVPSGQHRTSDKEVDILTLIRQFNQSSLFKFIPGRSRHAFQNIKEDPLSELDMESIRDWIALSLKKFQNKHFY